MVHDPLTRLFEVLAHEKAALLSGDYGALEQLGGEKQRWLAALEGASPSQQAIRDLRQLMAENQALTEAALHGVRAGMARIAALRQVQAGLTTYERDGSVAMRSTQTATVEKKA